MATTNYDVLTLGQFLVWLDKLQPTRKIIWMAWHHTYKPNTANVKAKGFSYYVKAVQREHITVRKWMDQAQHINVNNADGTIIIGRDWNLDGGGILNDPKGDITVEVFADFDSEPMTEDCKRTILGIAWACSKKFGIPLNETGHKYHHWFDLKTGKELLDNQTGVRKTCPGKNFFGGPTRTNFNAVFIPALKQYGEMLEKQNKEYVKKQRIDELILALGTQKRKDGVKPISDSPETWRGVFEGTVPVNLDNLLTLVRRSLKLE